MVRWDSMFFTIFSHSVGVDLISHIPGCKELLLSTVAAYTTVAATHNAIDVGDSRIGHGITSFAGLKPDKGTMLQFVLALQRRNH